MLRLFDNFEDIENYATDDLVDLVKDVKMKFFNAKEENESRPSGDLVKTYALMQNFLTNKFNKQKLLEYYRE